MSNICPLEVEDNTITRERLEISERRFRRLFEAAQDGILLLDKETGQITEVNPYLIKLLGYSREEFLDKKLWEIGAFSDESVARTTFDDLRRTGYVRYEDLPLQTKDRRLINVEFVSNVYTVGLKDVIQCNIRNITERKLAETALRDLNSSLAKRTGELARANEDLDASAQQLRLMNARLERQAMLDPLTGLLNRRGLQQVLTQEIQRAQRDHTACFALLVDLDDFKRINDTLGMTVGDMVLTRIAEELRGCLRATDHASRIGGDEFVLLFPATQAVKAILIAEKVRLAISGATILDSPVVQASVTASLGLVEISTRTASVEEVLSIAQSTLKLSKDTGKNKVSYEEGIVAGGDAESPDSLTTLLAALRRGNLFHVLRQPIVSFQTMKVVGYEALTRLGIKEFEMPGDYFRISLQTNMLTLVDHQCFKACIAAAALVPPDVSWHLNIFPSTLTNIPVEDIIACFPRPIRPGSYCIEINEQQVLSDLSHLTGVVRALKAAGLQIAMDDVGSGRSSLESLILLQPNIIKIDKSWVQGAGRDRARRETLRTMLRVAQSIGAQAVAEGIETEEDLDALRRLGIRFGQGYFLGMPAAPSETSS